MVAKNFRDEHALKGAFVSNQLVRLVDLIALQGDDLLREAEITIPSRAVGCTLYIGDNEEVSLADIAKAMDDSHQLTAQRVEGLIKLGLQDNEAMLQSLHQGLEPRGVVGVESRACRGG